LRKDFTCLGKDFTYLGKDFTCFERGGISLGNQIKYTHTNIVARDWKALAAFYTEVFGCRPVYPERDLSGDWLDGLTGVPEVRIRGIHLELPGHENGPTLEIFQYEPGEFQEEESPINRQGFGHLAFHVEDVQEVLDRLLARGGKQLGELVKKEIQGVGVLTAVYARDPEGNMVEIQNWLR
jgi:catechol 2,3-dioxygenase-like lactoylglutathione lyase family enzyme